MDYYSNQWKNDTLCTDTVARAMIKGMKQFSGYYGCDKCSQRGQNVSRMTYASVDNPQRTDSSFCALKNAHHTGNSPFSDLPLNMITFFLTDYTQQVCLSTVKWLLLCWTWDKESSLVIFPAKPDWHFEHLLQGKNWWGGCGGWTLPVTEVTPTVISTQKT